MSTNTMSEGVPIREQLEETLRELAAWNDELKKYTFDSRLRLRAGHSAVHAARQAAEIVFQQKHPGKRDVAPGLLGPLAFAYSERAARDLMDKVFRDLYIEDAIDPVRELTHVLEAREDVFALGVAATHAAVSLLGLGDYGGVFGAWQLQTLAFDWLTWAEHVKFNEHLLAFAERLCPRSVEAAKEDFGLPRFDFFWAGAHGNIAKATYRGVATESDASTRREAKRRGDEEMATIESRLTDELRRLLFWRTMEAMRAATWDAVGDHEAAHRFWGQLSSADIESVLRDLQPIEPQVELIQLVEQSAIRHSKT